MTASGDRMPAGPLASTVAHLGYALRPADPRPDADLVAAYARTRCELAAAELVRRHGPAVYGTCRRIHPPDADDAFQAVWLVFSRKAGRIRPPGVVAAWLHGVAVKVATKARTQSFTRRRRLMSAAKPDLTTDPPIADPLLQAVLDEELNRLPEPLRRAVLLCDLGGKTRAEAARELGWPEGTVATRLARGRAKLADRLRRRGVTLPAAGLAAILAPAATAVPVPPALGLAAVRVLLGTAAVPPAALPLADAAGSTMTPVTWKLAALGVLAAVGLTVGGVGVGPPDGPKSDKPVEAPAASGWVLKAVLQDHGHFVSTAEFAPDGKTFVTAAQDGSVIVWDTAALKPVSRMTVEAPAPHTGMRWTIGRPPTAHRRHGPPPTLHFADGKLEVDHWKNQSDWTKRTRFDPATGKAIDSPVLTDARGLRGIAPDGRRLVVDKAGRRVLPAADDAPAVTLEPSDTTGWSLGEFGFWSPDGRRLVLMEQIYKPAGGNLRVYDPATGKLLVKLTTPEGSWPWGDAVFSPDGRTLAAHFAAPEQADHPGLVAWDTAAWAERFRVEPTTGGGLGTVAFTPDGSHLLAAAPGGVQVWDAATGKPLEPLPVDPEVGVSDITLSPNGKTLVAAVGNPLRGRFDRPAGEVERLKAKGEVRVYVRAEVPPPPPAGEWRLKSVLKDHGQMVYDAAFSPDGRTLATAGADGTVIVRDAATLAVTSKFEVVKNLPPPGPAEVPPFDPVAKRLKPKLIGAEPREAGEPPPGLGLRFAADGQLRVSYTTAGDGRPEHAGFDPAAGKRVSAGVREDDLADVLHRAEGVFVQRPRGAEVKLDTPGRTGDVPAFDGIHVTLVSPDGKLAVVTQWDVERGGRLRLYDAATGRLLVERPLFKGAGGMPTKAAFSPDGRRLAVGTMTGQLAGFAGPDWAETFRHDDPLTRAVDALAFTADGKQLLVAGYREEHERGWLGRMRSNTTHREVCVRDAATGALVQSLSTHAPAAITQANGPFARTPDVGAIAVSPDGRTLAVAVGSPLRGAAVQPAADLAAKAAAGEVRVYVRKTAQPKPADPIHAGLGDAVHLKDHRQMVYDAAFSPDGKRFASIGADGMVIVRDTATLKAEATFEVVKNLPPEPPQLTAPLGNPPDLRLWWRANNLLRVRYSAGGDRWADLTPAGERVAGGEAAAGATPLSDGERVLARRGDGYVVARLDGGGFLPGVRLDLAPKLTGLPYAAFSSDGRLVAMVELQPPLRFVLRVCDAATGKALAERPLPGDAAGEPGPAAVVFARDGGRLFAALHDGTLMAWDAPGWVERYRAKPTGNWGGPPSALAVSADGAQVYEAGYHVQRDSVAFGLIPTGTTIGRRLYVRRAATGSYRMGTLTHIRHLKAGWTADADASPFIDRLAVSPDGGTILAPQGSAARGSNTQTAAGQRAKATLAELLVYRRTPD